MHGLLDAVLERLPALADAALVESWAGLRPGTPDGLPYLGPTPLQGYVLACGHYRNGILLAPLTAFLIAELVTGKRVELDDDFQLGRIVPDLTAVRRQAPALLPQGGQDERALQSAFTGSRAERLTFKEIDAIPYLGATGRDGGVSRR